MSFSQRAERVQRLEVQERGAVRMARHMLATIILPDGRHYDDLALIRDVSTQGVFLYSHLTPELGSVMTVLLSVPGTGGNVKTRCEGYVVRVEKFPNGQLSGVALRIERSEEVA